MGWMKEILGALKVTGQVAGRGHFWASMLRALFGPALLLVATVLVALYLTVDLMSIAARGFAPSNIALGLALLGCIILMGPLLLRSWCPPAARAVVDAMQLNLPEFPVPSLGRFVALWLLMAFTAVLLAVPTFFIPSPFRYVMLLPAALLFSGFQVRFALCIHADAGERSAVLGNTKAVRTLLWFPLCSAPLYLYAKAQAAVTALISSPYELTASMGSRIIDVLGFAASLAVLALVLVLWAALSLQALADRHAHAALGGRRVRRSGVPDPVAAPAIMPERVSAVPVQDRLPAAAPAPRGAPRRTVPSNPPAIGKWMLVSLGVLLAVAAIAYAGRQPLTHQYLVWTDPDYAQEAQYQRDRGTGEALATALKEAACNGNVARIRLLMRVGVAPTPESLGPALVCAAKTGQMQAINFLLAKKANINALPPDPGADSHLPMTALQYAVAGGNQALVDLLLSKGAQVSLQAPGAPGALHFAAANMDTSMISMLIAAGARPDEPTPKAPVFYFFEAASKGLTDRSPPGCAAVAAKAERAGLSMTGPGAAGGNLLHWAADRGELGLIEVLLARGLDRHRQDKGGAMPFMQLANWYRYTAQEPGPELEFLLKALSNGVSDINAPASVGTTLTPVSRSVETDWTLARAAAAKPRVRAPFGERISYAMLGGHVKEQQWPLTDRDQTVLLITQLSAKQLVAAPSLAVALRAKGWDDLAQQVESTR